MKKGEAIQQQAMKTRNERDHQKIACGGTRKADILHIPFKDLQRERKLKKKEQVKDDYFLIVMIIMVCRR